MPRPSKRVAPDTLGGRLRTARQDLHLSLADVAGERYSTSLISQIERNRVDPSPDSLHYLAERLKLPLDELLKLANQHRQSETEATLYKSYEEKYAEISRLLTHNQSAEALERFNELDPADLPLFLRWRTLALRGQAYFDQRKFSDAQRDFQSAITVLPSSVSEEYQLDVVRLRLHIAAATHELNQFEAALNYYRKALTAMSALTPLRYVAEVHWGLALVYYRQAQDWLSQSDNELEEEEEGTRKNFLQEAWRHAEKAYTLYDAITDKLNADLLQCQMALVEQAQGQVDESRQRLTRVLEAWQKTMVVDGTHPTSGEWAYKLAERANVVSASACCLAGLECQAGRLDKALEIVDVAIQAGEKSYKVRRAEAFMRQGEILEACHRDQKEIEAAYRKAVSILQNTDRVVTRIQAHYRLGYYLLRIGNIAEGQREIERAHALANIPRSLGSFSAPDKDSLNGMS
jgi:tetratricopeptide (TPR) repeat protein